MKWNIKLQTNKVHCRLYRLQRHKIPGNNKHTLKSWHWRQTDFRLHTKSLFACRFWWFLGCSNEALMLHALKFMKWMKQYMQQRFMSNKTKSRPKLLTLVGHYLINIASVICTKIIWKQLKQQKWCWKHILPKTQAQTVDWLRKEGVV